MNHRKSLYRFGYRRSPDQDGAAPVRHPVVVVGAGPVGLCAAIDLAQRGVPVVLLDDADRIGEGSRGICYAKRTLEILDRLGVARRCLEKGVTWRIGKVFQGDDLLYPFDLLPEDGHAMPAFINLQQYYLEHYLVERAAELPGLDLRWRNRVTGLRRRNDGVTLNVETPDGPYAIEAGWVVAADGARSSLRTLLGLDFRGEVFEDRFLIADVRMKGDFPTERWFWFDPPFHEGRSALLHKQPDDVWRIDLQLGREADVAAEQAPERVIPRCAPCWGTGISPSNGSRSTPSSAGAWSASSTAAWSSRAMPPIRSRPSGPGAPIRHPGRREPRLEARPRAPGRGARISRRNL
jgi:3-(3-hydroxy-phenyl)propionate hydroxylase